MLFCFLPPCLALGFSSVCWPSADGGLVHWDRRGWPRLQRSHCLDSSQLCPQRKTRIRYFHYRRKIRFPQSSECCPMRNGADQAPDHSRLSCPSIETPTKPIRSNFPLLQRLSQ